VSLQNIASIVLVLGIVVFIGVRQLRWSPIVESRLWRQPVILALVGVFVIYRSLGTATPDVADVALLVVEAVISIGIGCAMGGITRFRPLAQPTETARLESSSGRIGLVLWIVYILIRIGFGVWTAYSGSEVLDATGVILVMIGLNRLGRASVLATRLNRFAAVTAGRVAA
jgi:hypothetical protein